MVEVVATKSKLPKTLIVSTRDNDAYRCRQVLSSWTAAALPFACQFQKIYGELIGEEGGQSIRSLVSPQDSGDHRPM
jgi:hypothetical protein